MKIVRFSYQNRILWGKYCEESGRVETSLSQSDRFRTFGEVMAFFRAAEGEAEAYPDRLLLSDVTLLAPVLPSKNILCIGKNYEEHILEFDGSAQALASVREKPIFFTKALSSLTGPDEPIFLHEDVTDSVDYEAELAVVIGKRGVHIPKEKALEYVYGYTILNDITARDLQQDHRQWFRGKSLDSHCPVGPFLVTADEIPDPQNLKIQSCVNGELRQDSNTKHMIHDVASLVATLSKGMTLEPGDVIATGTPKGVGMGYRPPRFLKHGDLVCISIEHIGTLSNTAKSSLG